ncbi:hypothetical protein GJ744_006723 [Endocarpon pusillum]|uniref:DUF676 domain-containing protein n=1 Tax=Endocarpon pusillum TaxID=364733 RepID=A0A8H7E4Q7_9EURO|nr:hypothetical protein GJ744_006723 [Endocarpon pusillum]
MPSWLSLRGKAKRPKSDTPAATIAAGSCSISTSQSGKIFPSGLRLLHQPDAAVVDIVFIHGLTGDREKTWSGNSAVTPWPKILLPKELPQARILTFGYDAYIADWRAMVSKNRISNHSKNLLAALANHRENDDTNNRPIIFVAHSLGGLVCEDALLASRNSADKYQQNILEYTRGIIFLGTPHSGSGLAEWAEKLAKLIGLIKKTNPQILTVLETDSEVLARIQADFHTMIRARGNRCCQPIHITCFFEELPLPGIGEVVPMHSAILPAYVSIGIHSNHMDMTKFETEDDPGFISVTGELRRWVKELISMPVTTSRTSQGRFMISFDQDPLFTGRDDIIGEIDQRLETKRRIALAGIGGVGKSQIAIEYCYRFRAKNPSGSVFWVHASNVSRFQNAYKNIARKLGLPGWEDPKTNTLELVSEWLSNEDHGPWLIILDNADDGETFFGTRSDGLSLEAEHRAPLVSYLPRNSKGSIIITTRDARVGERLSDREKSITVLPLVVQEAEHLLQSKLQQDAEWSEPDAAELLKLLDCLPLAITQAAAFISENRITVLKYTDILHASYSELTDLLSEDLQDPRRDLDAPSSVIRTWKLSFDQIQRQKPRAAQMLSLMAVLDRQGIPEEVLHREDERSTEFITALGTLQAFSLITAEKGRKTFTMHRLVHLSIQHWLELQNTKAEYQEEAMKMLSELFPVGKHENWKICEALSPHARVVLGYNYTSQPSMLHRATLLYNAAWYDWQQGRYQVAYRGCSESYNIRQRLLSENTSESLGSLELMALALRDQGKYEAAEEMHRRALDGYEKVSGKENPDTLTCVHNLASVLNDQGKYKAAEEMNQRALDGYEKVLGKEHPDTLMSVDNLASVLRDQGKYKAAEEMHRRALDGFEKVLGKEHPNTLTCVHNLAFVLRDQGKYKAAEEMNRRALDGYEKVLGKEHPDTLRSVNNLTLVLRDQGKYKAAEEMLQRALDGYEKVLGKEHPNTLTCVHNIAFVLRDQGKYKAAEEMNRRALDGFEKVLGKEHPNTLMSVDNLASVLRDQGKYEAAEEMHQRALDGYEKVLGKEHPDTLRSVDNLASTLSNQGKYEAAEEMNRRALDGREKVLGKEHPDTLTSVFGLAYLLKDQRRYDESSILYQRACAGYEKVLGSNHPTTVACSKNYNFVHQEMKGQSQAN